jgi:hypothetical protein
MSSALRIPPAASEGSEERRTSVGTAAQYADAFMAAMDKFVSAGLAHASDCPFHEPLLRLASTREDFGRDMAPLDRFMAAGASEQASLFRRPDNGKLSTSKGCLCGKGVDLGGPEVDHKGI